MNAEARQSEDGNWRGFLRVLIALALAGVGYLALLALDPPTWLVFVAVFVIPTLVGKFMRTTRGVQHPR